MTPMAMTGLGVVSPIGMGRRSFWSALGDSDAARKMAFGGSSDVLDPAQFPAADVAEVSNFDATETLGKKGLRNFDRLTKFLIVAAKQALEDAGIKRDGEFVTLGPEHVGICSATAYGSLDAITELQRVAELEDPRYINPARFPNTVINAAAGYVSIWEDLRAPNTTIVDGNCGALDAVLTAETHLAHERGKAFLVGGGEVISEPLYVALSRLGLIGGDDRESTMRVGEGAAYVCVERLADARARSATILGCIEGYGTAFDPPESEARLAHGSADAVARAIRSALVDAGRGPAEVDLICGAECGYEPLDRAEREGTLAVFGPDVAIALPKQLLGETFGSAGGLGIAASLAWMQGVPVSPLANGIAPASVATVVVLAVGFYGNVSAVVLRRAEAE